MIQLRPNQIAAVDAIEAAWRNGIKRPLVDSCVGSGKSLIFAEAARRVYERGGRSLILAHTRELVEQNASACRLLMPGVHIGINAAALNERTWRAPVISCAIQSVYKYARNFGPVTFVGGDEAHLWPHSESGMFHTLSRELGDVWFAGASGTIFRLQGGSLVEGEGAPFDAVVFVYSILDGIRDGYLCPAFSFGADDKVDQAKLKTRQGEFTGESSDKQMLAKMDSHIAQMLHYGRERRGWLIFEASTTAAEAMAKRLGEWGIPTGLVLGKTNDAERAAVIDAYRQGRLRALVNINALTTGFDVQHVDLLVMRRPTKSLGLYIQEIGRGLRTIGGRIETSIAAGKADCGVLDFAGNIDRHGPLDFIRPQESRAKLVTCEHCKARVPAAARKCWNCSEPMVKLCPACLGEVEKGTLDCPHCFYDMRTGEGGGGSDPKLLDRPSGAALISSYQVAPARAGGWLPIRQSWLDPTTKEIVAVTADGQRWAFGPLASRAAEARWLRGEGGEVSAILVPNGKSRTSARQVTREGVELPVPLPATIGEAA